MQTYASLTNSYIFQPIAVESHGSFSASFLSFLTTLGERVTGTSGDLREMSYLFQRLSVIVQRFNSVLIYESFISADEEPGL